MILRTTALVALVALVACSAPPTHEVADAQGIPDVITMSDPGVQRYTGTLATTATVPFGGPPHCNYSVTLKSVAFDVTVHPTNGLTTMSIGDTMVEAVVGTCGAGPQPQSRQQFAHDGAPTPGANGTFTPQLVGIATNRPRTAATVVVRPMLPAALDVTVRWARTDQTGTLNWVVTTTDPVRLNQVPCAPGGVYCLGDSEIGGLYGCVDATHFIETTHCPQGCAVPSGSQPPKDTCK